MLRRSFAALCLLCFAAIPPAIGSHPNPAGKKATETTMRAGPLTAEAARSALLAMVAEKFPTHDLLGPQLPILQKEPAEKTEKGIVTIGGWYCGLSGRRFGITFGMPPRFIRYEGKFEMTRSGKWKATITRETHAGGG